MIDLKQFALCSLLGALVGVVIMIAADIVIDIVHRPHCPAGSALIQSMCVVVVEPKP